MNDTVETIQEEPEAAPVTELPRDSLPASDYSGNADAELDQLLRDYDAAVNKPAEPRQQQFERETPDAPIDGSGELDQLLADLNVANNAEQQKITALEGEIGSLRQAEIDRQSRSDFEGFSKKLQSELGPNVDPDFARTNLLALSVERPELQMVWQHRHATDEQIRAADAEFTQLEKLYNQALRAPNDPRKFEAMAQLERRGQELALLMNSRKILNNVWRDVVKRAGKAPPPIDELATADHDAVAFAVREMQSGDIPEPPVKLGQLTDAEFKEYTRKNFGF